MIFYIKKFDKEVHKQVASKIEESFIFKYGTKYEVLSDFKISYLDYYIEKSNSYIAIIEENSKILCFAIFKYLDNDQILEDFESHKMFNNLNESELNKIIQKIPLNCIYIEYIESFFKGFGGIMSTILLHKYQKIFLYSDIDAIEFWEKMNFDNIFGYNYIKTLKRY